MLEEKKNNEFNAFVGDIQSALDKFSPDEMLNHVERVVEEHDDWRRRSLNLNPAESVLSRRCQAILASDMATRLSEGLPGSKIYPHEFQNRYIDEIEGIVIALLRRQFNAKHVEWRPTSTSMANAAVFFSLLKGGDVILSQSEDGGGNFSYHNSGPAGLRDLQIYDIPSSTDYFEIDVDRLATEVDRLKPKLIAIGGSNVLFPYPVKEIRAIADRVGALVLYDAAHLGLLVSNGVFQRPLEEGAHVLTASTHKVMFGPVGGFAVSNDDEIAEKILTRTFPGFMQTRDQNKFAALACSLLELEKHGAFLAEQMVRNAQALAGYLAEEGLDVLAAERGYTKNHQIFVRIGQRAREFELGCQRANILLTDVALYGDRPQGKRTGLRLATHELTRFGLRESDMKDIARFIVRAGGGEENPVTVAGELGEFLRTPRLDLAKGKSSIRAY
ncbi:aminotransferase class I/II-fold pyridoxal phosphate-dependent enzyme [Pseudomonas sp. DWRC2-2]|uniref:aminotransferase class I/II-fold pyridoxal phosphate-dependent enzyme n=1 Tax=Pseudomonas sp. DWRC2-2 TaxID=2804567 RepID=UPI003CE6FF38